jgi:threonine/homoserine/homoserine lactone efflux protein
MLWIIIAIVLFFLVVLGVAGTAKGVQERVRKKEWWRLWVAGGVLAATAIAISVIGIK